MKILDLGRSLSERLLVPLMQGGEVRPVAPVGEARAVELSKALSGARVFDEVEALRLRAARRWAPVDDLGDIAADEWLLVAALNDLLQLTNPALGRGLGARRIPLRLARLVERVLSRAGPPRSVASALSRHALFGRVVELARVDTQVSWWSGSARFVGHEPPERLLQWPRLRKVRRLSEHVRLGQMDDGKTSDFGLLLQRWLALTPLTTLGTSRTSGVPFRWTGPLLALTSTKEGRRMALRVLLTGADVAAALAELSSATEVLASIDARACAHARDFLAEAEALRRQFSEEPAAALSSWPLVAPARG